MHRTVQILGEPEANSLLRRSRFRLGPRLAVLSPLLVWPVVPAWAGAPSFDLFGAFFPAWLLFGALGVLMALLARGVFVATGLDAVLRLRLFAYTAIGVMAGALGWLAFFGPAP